MPPAGHPTFSDCVLGFLSFSSPTASAPQASLNSFLQDIPCPLPSPMLTPSPHLGSRTCLCKGRHAHAHQHCVCCLLRACGLLSCALGQSLAFHCAEDKACPPTVPAHNRQPATWALQRPCPGPWPSVHSLPTPAPTPSRCMQRCVGLPREACPLVCAGVVPRSLVHTGQQGVATVYREHAQGSCGEGGGYRGLFSGFPCKPQPGGEGGTAFREPLLPPRGALVYPRPPCGTLGRVRQQYGAQDKWRYQKGHI